MVIKATRLLDIQTNIQDRRRLNEAVALCTCIIPQPKYLLYEHFFSKCAELNISKFKLNAGVMKSRSVKLRFHTFVENGKKRKHSCWQLLC